MLGRARDGRGGRYGRSNGQDMRGLNQWRRKWSSGGPIGVRV